jgi:tetratricopeptide (TPR) repeat protein
MYGYATRTPGFAYLCARALHTPCRHEENPVKSENMVRTRVFLISCLLGAFFLTLSCSSRDDYFAVGPREKQKEISKLLEMLRRETKAGENRFILIQQISNNLLNTGYRDRLNFFLTDYVEKNPTDPYNAYYIFIVAQNHKNSKAFPFAAYYYRRILKNHPDILIRGQSIHLLCLKELITITEKPEYRINYYKELIARFKGEIDEGSILFFLAKTYESLGEWEQAIQAYTKFLKYPDTAIPGYADAQRSVMNLVAFHNSNKSWTRESLDELIKAVKSAIAERDARALARLRAGVNFFSMSWEQDDSESNTQVLFDLGSFLRGSKISYAKELDIDSNAREAYLETWGWSYRMPTWYLYFRKINYPGDPEINGRWEWAGIYFGEKL